MTVSDTNIWLCISVQFIWLFGYSICIDVGEDVRCYACRNCNNSTKGCHDSTFIPIFQQAVQHPVSFIQLIYIYLYHLFRSYAHASVYFVCIQLQISMGWSTCGDWYLFKYIQQTQQINNKRIIHENRNLLATTEQISTFVWTASKRCDVWSIIKCLLWTKFMYYNDNCCRDLYFY